MRYLFMPVVDNDTLSTLQHALPTPEFTFVIVPTNHEILLRSALGGYSNPKAPNIQSFDDFMSWRVNFGGMDSGWPRDRVLGFLISRYNFHAASAGLGQSMLVRKPYRRRQNSRPDRAR
jgi:hypothetical protein